MDRVDSGFDESYSSKAMSSAERPLLHRSNTAPTRRRKPKKTAPDLAPQAQSAGMESQRPASEKAKLSRDRRKSTEPRRKSISSSSEHSTSRSRRNGQGSKPSSRRTSCTLVDPSRPTRHYRIRSSQTVPTANRDIDDVLALHFRSCSLFQNPIYHSGNLNTSISGYGSPVSSVPRQSSVDRIDTNNTFYSAKQSEETIEPVEIPNTITHWTSPTTRRREYEKIDRANSGIRGFVRKIIPRYVSGPPPPRFYEKDKSDAGSVRRYRMDLAETDDEEEASEKSTASLRVQPRKLEKSSLNATKKTKRWGCF
ncbi:hypothetical protein K469DRAFT_544923 [Zopfia rhizophila CBS 207.26]|uniref:Pal1-domain-containing protein n=1 Tax=Zopfia rhizophila CBS 207.26 TaxID=1314779 RepID=A0A6A6EYT5_9PEZI|nr:hypothetical protein K469DRAFT_544923 [Zopfia rhizophila CBS 207.26]